jgi:type I restriction enzyme S subunit
MGPYTVFAASGPHGTHSECKVQGPGVITGRSGVIGRVFYAHEDYWPLNTSLWVKQFKVATPAYAFQYLQTIDLARLNAGSAVPTLNRNHVHAQPAVIPAKALVAAYTAVAMPLLERVRANSEHAACLEELRDTLLPRLISGKLSLPDVEAELGETLYKKDMAR